MKLSTWRQQPAYFPFSGAIFLLGRSQGPTAVGDDTLHVILDLTEDSSQAKVTSVCIQYVVPCSIGKAKIGAWTSASCKPVNAVAQAGRQTNGTSLPVKATSGSARSAKLGMKR